MDTRFEHIDEALTAITLREESIARILRSETGFELFNHATGKRFQEMNKLRDALHVKHTHYLECELIIVNIM